MEAVTLKKKILVAAAKWGIPVVLPLLGIVFRLFPRLGFNVAISKNPILSKAAVADGRAPVFFDYITGSNSTGLVHTMTDEERAICDRIIAQHNEVSEMVGEDALPKL
jgi:hypothetical protein